MSWKRDTCWRDTRSPRTPTTCSPWCAPTTPARSPPPSGPGWVGGREVVPPELARLPGAARRLAELNRSVGRLQGTVAARGQSAAIGWAAWCRGTILARRVRNGRTAGRRGHRGRRGRRGTRGDRVAAWDELRSKKRAC